MRSGCIAIEFRHVGTQFIPNTAERGEARFVGPGDRGRVIELVKQARSPSWFDSR